MQMQSKTDKVKKMYPHPTDEQERLQELYDRDLFKSPPPEDFDHLTSFAKDQLDVSASAVSFVDENRTFLKSTAGLPFEEVPREQSLCTYTILDDSLNVITDTREVEDFGKDFVVIDGQEVRSYAGAPLRTKKGNNLGAFFVCSFSSMKFSKSERELLTILRDQAMAIIESHHNEKKIEQLLDHDSASGLPNRESFTKDLESMISEASKSNKMIAVGQLNLLQFCQVSEKLGYEAAERILQVMADRLNSQLSEQTLKACVLGQQFLIGIPDIDSRAEIQQLIKSIISNMKEPISIMGESIVCSVKVGFSLYPETAQQADDLLRQANAAVREASVEISSTVKFYRDGMALISHNSPHLESDFLDALKTDEFTLNYQPQVNLADNSLSGVEALIRWNHPEHGMIPPPTIISLAEKLGEMSRLGQWVMREACNQVHHWNDNYNTQFDLGVNVSSLELQQGETFVNSVKEILNSTGFAKDNLTLEVTETEVMDDIDFTTEILNRLKNIPVKIAVDDYGTGHASLKYLVEFPEPILKIDRAFIDGINDDPSKQTIVKNTLTMADSMNLKTIAEGVEGKQEKDFLRENGCDFYQGYYFSKPMNADSFEKRYISCANGGM